MSDKYLSQEEVNKIAILAPQAKINMIKNYEVAEKMVLQLPDELIGVIKCKNPKCITNNEPMSTKFRTIDKKLSLFKCHYCERIMEGENAEIL